MADWKEQSLLLWQNIGKKQRYLIIGAAALLFVAILAWSYWMGSRPDYVPLFTGMEAKDAGEVAAKLKEMKIPHEIGNNGSTILVPSKDVYRIRLEMATQGLPRGSKGFEIFDQTKFGVTDFQQRINLLQALQGELTRTIEQMTEVEKARVHIVLPTDSLYKKDEKPATASIMLKLRPSAQLSRDQVKGIVNLVAHSIQGLKPENVTVVDNFARILNDQSDTPYIAGTGTLTQLELTKKVQDNLQKNIQSLLEQVLGPGKAVARINVELNFDQRTVDRQVFEPVVDDKGVIRSSQEANENYKGTSAAPGGPPGTTSNIPGYVTNASGTQSTYEKKEVTRNYEINETKEKVVVAPGSVKRLTVAVLVDANVNKAQQESITKTVSSAVGFNSARGDVISVESLPFNTESSDRQRKDELEFDQQQQYMLWLKYGLAALAIIGLLIFIRNRNIRKQEHEEDLEAITMTEPIPATASPTKELSPQEQEKAQQREALEKFAKAKPDDVAQLIKTWLTEE
jgi:flagellar M-ring protein FliF